MANTAALIRESIWRNREFRALPRGAQCMYLQLCSQKDLDCAGLLTLNIGLLAKGCNEIDADAVLKDLQILETERFVFFDEDTDELFVRAYMRTAEVVKSPNIFKSALKSARLVESVKLRVEVAAELRRLRRAEADKVADQLNPSETVPPQPTNPSETLPKNGTLPEPSSTGTVTGTVSPLVGGNSEITTLRENARGTRLPDGWMPDPDVVAQMRSDHPQVDLKAEHAKFVDYWHGIPGAKGRKTDWPATWRNWIRRAAEQTPRNGHARAPTLNGAPSKLRSLAELAQEARQAENAHLETGCSPKELT